MGEQLDYLVKTRPSGFKITTKHIIELWNIERFQFNYTSVHLFSYFKL